MGVQPVAPVRNAVVGCRMAGMEEDKLNPLTVIRNKSRKRQVDIMRRLLALLGAAVLAALTCVDAKADDNPDCISYKIRWGGQYWQGGYDENDGEKPCGYRDEPGCCIQFTDVLTEFFYGGSEYADITIDSYGKGLPYTIYRDDVAIATGVTEYGLAGSMWFTDYDVVPGKTYKYEIKVKGEDVDHVFGSTFCADVTNKQEYTTGPLGVECYFIHTAELEANEVLFDENGGDRDFGIAIFKKTVNQTIREDRPGYWMVPDVDWIGVRDTSQLDWQRSSITISVDENDTGAAREGIITVGYQGFEWQIKVRQDAKSKTDPESTEPETTEPGPTEPEPTEPEPTEPEPPIATPEPEPEPEPEQPVVTEILRLWSAEPEGVVPSAASEYNGYLYDAKGNVKGTIQVKVGKPNKKSGAAAVKATVVGLDGKKVQLKAEDKGKVVIASSGPTTVSLVGGESCAVKLGAEELYGKYGSYFIDGVRNFFTSKDKAEQAAANAILEKWLGSVNVMWNGGSVNVAIAKKGKAKVKGTLADGKTKVSANAVFLIGEQWNCVPVVAPKANLAFAVWLRASEGARPYQVEGLGSSALVGKPGTLKSGATFHIDAAAFAAVWGQTALPYLPDGVAVSQDGAKWVVAGGAKAGRLLMKGGVLDDSKAGENPSGLKLTYKAKDGSFKGSFKAYAEDGGRLKATTVNVTGVAIGGVGYGTATIKGKGSVDVTIK